MREVKELMIKDLDSLIKAVEILDIALKKRCIRELKNTRYKGFLISEQRSGTKESTRTAWRAQYSKGLKRKIIYLGSDPRSYKKKIDDFLTRHPGFTEE